jgi:hypothetical protein
MTAEPVTSRLHSLDAVAKSLGGISVWTLRKHIARGTVRVVRLGKRVFIAEAELSRLAAQGLPSLSAVAVAEETRAA